MRHAVRLALTVTLAASVISPRLGYPRQIRPSFVPDIVNDRPVSDVPRSSGPKIRAQNSDDRPATNPIRKRANKVPKAGNVVVGGDGPKDGVRKEATHGDNNLTGVNTRAFVPVSCALGDGTDEVNTRYFVSRTSVGNDKLSGFCAKHGLRDVDVTIGPVLSCLATAIPLVEEKIREAGGDADPEHSFSLKYLWTQRYNGDAFDGVGVVIWRSGNVTPNVFQACNCSHPVCMIGTDNEQPMAANAVQYAKYGDRDDDSAKMQDSESTYMLTPVTKIQYNQDSFYHVPCTDGETVFAVSNCPVDPCMLSSFCVSRGLGNANLTNETLDDLQSLLRKTSVDRVWAASYYGDNYLGRGITIYNGQPLFHYSNEALPVVCTVIDKKNDYLYKGSATPLVKHTLNIYPNNVQPREEYPAVVQPTAYPVQPRTYPVPPRTYPVPPRKYPVQPRKYPVRDIKPVPKPQVYSYDESLASSVSAPWERRNRYVRSPPCPKALVRRADKHHHLRTSIIAPKSIYATPVRRVASYRKHGCDYNVRPHVPVRRRYAGAVCVQPADYSSSRHWNSDYGDSHSHLGFVGRRYTSDYPCSSSDHHHHHSSWSYVSDDYSHCSSSSSSHCCSDSSYDSCSGSTHSHRPYGRRYMHRHYAPYPSTSRDSYRHHY